jgi:hypothetical protein
MIYLVPCPPRDLRQVPAALARSRDARSSARIRGTRRFPKKILARHWIDLRSPGARSQRHSYSEDIHTVIRGRRRRAPARRRRRVGGGESRVFIHDFFRLNFRLRRRRASPAHPRRPRHALSRPRKPPAARRSRRAPLVAPSLVGRRPGPTAPRIPPIPNPARLSGAAPRPVPAPDPPDVFPAAPAGRSAGCGDSGRSGTSSSVQEFALCNKRLLLLRNTILM